MVNSQHWVSFVAGALAFGLAGAGPVAGAAPSKAPNILILLADDMGYADLSCYGAKAVRTPYLDSLAAAGMRFTQFYAASAVCSPSRAALLTGRYPLRFDIRIAFTDHQEHLPRGTVTLPKLLAGAGYATAHVGKWHLGGLNRKHFEDRAHAIPGPHEHGFASYLCQIEDQPPRRDLGKTRRLYRDGGTCLVRDDRALGAEDPYYRRHWTDITGDEAMAQLEQLERRGQPFFLNVWWLAPHAPYEPSPEPYWSQTAAADIANDQHCFRSMVEHMDAKVGQIIAKLKALNLYENTFILFMSDNGAAFEGDVGPFKAGKTDLHEGGIRVPMFAVWPGRIPAGTTSDALAHMTDILPTCCAAAGVALPADLKVDGIDLLPHLTRRAALPERGTLFWQLDLIPQIQRHTPKPKPYATEAARRGPWKLLARNGEPLELFNLEADPGEKINQLDQQPALVAKFSAAIKRWLNEPRQTWTQEARAPLTDAQTKGRP